MDGIIRSVANLPPRRWWLARNTSSPKCIRRWSNAPGGRATVRLAGRRFALAVEKVHYDLFREGCRRVAAGTDLGEVEVHCPFGLSGHTVIGLLAVPGLRGACPDRYDDVAASTRRSYHSVPRGRACFRTAKVEGFASARWAAIFSAEKGTWG